MKHPGNLIRLFGLKARLKQAQDNQVGEAAEDKKIAKVMAKKILEDARKHRLSVLEAPHEVNQEASDDDKPAGGINSKVSGI